METKETAIKMEAFKNQVEQLSNTHLDDNMGYLLFTYNLVDEKTIESGFGAKGNLHHTADCILSVMKQNEMLAYIITAAANAYGYMRMAQAQAEMPATPEEAIMPKRNRKKSK